MCPCGASRGRHGLVILRRTIAIPMTGQGGRRLRLDDVEPAGQGKQVNHVAGRCSFHHAAIPSWVRTSLTWNFPSDSLARIESTAKYLDVAFVHRRPPIASYAWLSASIASCSPPTSGWVSRARVR